MLLLEGYFRILILFSEVFGGGFEFWCSRLAGLSNFIRFYIFLQNFICFLNKEIELLCLKKILLRNIRGVNPHFGP